MKRGLKSLAKNLQNKINSTKAGALMCPSCCVEYVEVQFDCEFDGVLLRDVKALKCPRCEEEVFSPQQQEDIKKKLEA